MSSTVRIVILFAFVIAFIGQSFAFESLSCSMSMEDNQAMDHSNMDHSSMGHVNVETEDVAQQTMVHQSMQSDCCGDECQCPQSACTSFSYVGNQLRIQTLSRISEKIVDSAFTLIHTDINLPFRPPISA